MKIENETLFSVALIRKIKVIGYVSKCNVHVSVRAVRST